MYKYPLPKTFYQVVNAVYRCREILLMLCNEEKPNLHLANLIHNLDKEQSRNPHNELYYDLIRFILNKAIDNL